jgi:hypothetical protein
MPKSDHHNYVDHDQAISRSLSSISQLYLTALTLVRAIKARREEVYWRQPPHELEDSLSNGASAVQDAASLRSYNDESAQPTTYGSFRSSSINLYTSDLHKVMSWLD